MRGIVMSPEWAEDFEHLSLDDVDCWVILNVEDGAEYNPDGLCVYGVLPGGARVEFVIPYSELAGCVTELEQRMYMREAQTNLDPFAALKEELL